MTLKWHGDEVQRELLRLTKARLAAAAQYLVGEVKETLSLTGVGTVRGKRRTGKSVEYIRGRRVRQDTYGGPKKAGQRIYNYAPSLPGEPPRKQTGHLRRSITWEADQTGLVVRVGTNLPYGKFLELGTRKMKPRPFLRKTLNKSWNGIRNIIDVGGVGEANYPREFAWQEGRTAGGR